MPGVKEISKEIFLAGSKEIHMKVKTNIPGFLQRNISAGKCENVFCHPPPPPPHHHHHHHHPHHPHPPHHPHLDQTLATEG